MGKRRGRARRRADAGGRESVVQKFARAVREDCGTPAGAIGDALGFSDYQFADYQPRPTLPRNVVDDLYTKSLLVQRMVRGLPDDAIAVEPEITSSLVDGAALLAEARSRKLLDRQGALYRAAEYARKDGGGGVLVLLEDGLAPWEPVDLDAITRVRGFVPFTAWELPVVAWDQAAGATWYAPDRFDRPLFYDAAPSGGGSGAIRGRWHRSRVIPMYHVELERRLAERWRGWGPGVIEGLFPEIIARAGGIRRVGDLLRSYGYDHLELGDLDQKLMEAQGEDFMRGYLDDLRSMRDFSGTGVAVVATQTGTKIQPLARSAANVDKLTDAQRLALLDSYEGPAIQLFGQSYAGLSGDDMEGEWSLWRRVLRAYRRGPFWTALRQALTYLQAAKTGPTGGVVDYSLEVGGAGWEPEEAQSEDERAATRERDAQARAEDAAVLGLTPAELRAHDPTVARTYPTLPLEVAAPAPPPATADALASTPGDLLTEPEARRLFRFGQTAFKRMVERGLLRNHGTASHRRYSAAEVAEGLATLRGDSIADPPRTFTMIRHGDVHGVSGVGEVLDGVLWPGGRVTVRWACTGKSSTETSFDSFADFLAVHVDGHEGNGTEIAFHDGGPPPVA